MNVRHLLSLTIGLSMCVAMLQAGQGGPGKGGIAINANAVMGDIQRLVGEEVCFTLTAKDENGNVIRSWDQIGNPVTLTLSNTDANSDSSTQSWNADPDGYSWAVLKHDGVELAKISATEWSIPNTDFVDGMAEVCLTCTKADTGVFITITPTLTFLNQVSQSVDFVADEITNYLVDITSATSPEDGVYLLRPYELIVVPRDRYLNFSDKTIRTRFSARFPGEFDQNQPGLADIFSGEVFIQGMTNYLIASRLLREKPIEPQYIVAYSSDDFTVQGQTDPFEVLSHAPAPFALIDPPDHHIMNLTMSVNVQDFTWQRPNPPDPYWDIQVSRFDQTRLVSDEVRYTWVLVDSISLTRAQRIPSNGNGLNPDLSLTHGQMWGLLQAISGQASTRSYQCVWYVEATDGLFTTQSDPTPGHHITLTADAISSVKAPQPEFVTLSQNYPNPFNPSTTIRFSTTKRSQVSLKVFDLLGGEVATIHSGIMAAGEHSVLFDASKLRSGVYMYRLEAEGKSLSRRMVVMK